MQMDDAKCYYILAKIVVFQKNDDCDNTVYHDVFGHNYCTIKV